jgi:hypothetical protein
LFDDKLVILGWNFDMAWGILIELKMVMQA